MPDGDDPVNPDGPDASDGWKGLEDYTTDVTLPDGSTLTQSSDGKGGPTKNTLRDPDGNIQTTWDGDEVPHDSDAGIDLDALSEHMRSNGPETSEKSSGPEFPLFNEHAVPRSARKSDGGAKEPLLQRYWRRIREGKDPGPDPRSSGDTEFPDDYVIKHGIVSEETMNWFRRGPVMIPILIIAGTLVIVVSVSLFSSDDEASEPDADVIDEPLPGLDDDDEAEQASETELESDAAVDTENEDESDDGETEPDDAGSSSVPVMSGTRLIAGAVDSECGGQYDVTLRHMRFDNQEETLDQTFTLGGNAIQSAAGWGNSNVSFLSLSQTGFYEVWFFFWNFGEIFAVLNVYGTSADFAAPTSAADLAELENIQSAADLLAAVDGSADSCASELQISSVETSAFPESNG